MTKIFIIEAKLSLGKIRRLNDILESNQEEFTRADSYTRADYIVTELKSPSRIIRNARKSVCPVVHISWLLESIKLGKQLDPQDYLIDVSEERKKKAIELSVRALPRQLTWDQVAKRRMSKDIVNTNADVLERRRFYKNYGSRNKPLKKVGVSSATKNSSGFSIKSGSPSTTLCNLKKEINHFATRVSPTLAPTNNNSSATTTKHASEKKQSYLASAHSPPKKNSTPPPDTSTKNDKSASAVLAKLRQDLCFTTSALPPSYTKKVYPSSVSCYSTAASKGACSDTKSSKHGQYSTTLNNLESQVRLTARHTSLKEKPTESPAAKNIETPAIIVNASQETLFPRSDHSITNELSYTTMVNNKDVISSSVEKITRRLSASSSDDAVPTVTSLNHSCSSLSTNFDPNQYSLSEILSL